MHPLLVDDPSRRRLEAGPAHFALVRPLPGVLHLVGDEGGLALELLLAVAALELRLKVLGHVLLHVVRPARGELAVLALDGVVHLVLVGPHLAVVGEHLGAHGARGRLGKVDVPPVDVETLLAGQLHPANVAVEEELGGNSIGNN